jgi:hypothetical protein
MVNTDDRPRIADIELRSPEKLDLTSRYKHQ